MHKAASRPSGFLKRKRKSSEGCSNIENKPLKEEKRFKADREEGGSGSSSDGRLPLTELAVCKVGRNDHGRLSPSSRKTPEPGYDPLPLVCFPDSPLDDSPRTPKFFRDPEGPRECPLPKLNWTDEALTWAHFCRKDDQSYKSRDSTYFDNHPTLLPRMRSVLLEWVIEVCEVYKLHRETYYVAVDYLDRYLSVAKNVPKSELQLIGVTCLLIASKVEEVYPPKLSEFAYVTDGACSEEDILTMELTIITTIGWNCKVFTANAWLSLYMQLYCMKSSKRDLDIMYPQFTSKSFDDVVQLLDLISLDLNFLRYSYSVLAASVFYVACSKPMTFHVTSLKYSEIADCVAWVDAFWEAVQDDKSSLEPITIKPVLNTKPNEFSHALLKHTVSIDLLEAAQSVLYLKADLESSAVLTPPSSSKKP